MKSALIFFLICVFHVAPPEDVPIAIIVNSKNTISALSLTEVRMYWMRRPKKRWEEIDKAIKPVDRKDKCPEKEVFYKKIIKLTEDAVNGYFSARQYQTGENIPDKFSSDKEIIDFVNKEIGAIGFVNASSLTPEALEKVKVVFTLK